MSCKKIISTIVSSAVFLPALVFAQGGGGSGGGTGGGGSLQNPFARESLFEVIDLLVNTAIAFGIPIAALFIIYAGFLFVTARGSEEKITRARASITWAVVGTAILLGAKVIITVINATITQF